ncbi:MAG: hypothetical protein IH870_01990 [Chloroflexi bacterium]|nr:hypothetical protein [Chloroflexota bacterium]
MFRTVDSDNLNPNNSSCHGLHPRLGRPGWSGFWAAIRDNRGTFLLETVVASMIFSMVGVAVLSSLGTVNIAGALTEEQSQAENIARNQMEAIFNRVYREPDQTPYPTIALPPGYTVTIDVTHLDGYTDPEVEKIALTISHHGKEVLLLETARYRTDGMRLAYSASPDRSNPSVLVDAVLDGTVYVFLDDPTQLIDDQVEFFMDGFGPLQTENFIHWDFEGSAGVDPADPANPWNTSAETNGPHTITAKARLNNGETVNVTADFTISN